ncbi:MAG TPA: DNA repair protein RecN [Elusimicrobia bacterium]|nr:DNA repair protein RecN [Elusimicrobiota bacterium]HBT62318.1 DNA repair protein RecN [Elusimicrobiota bacterium]
MLRALSVRDFAVISELRLEPQPGLNVFTGETGAGKSILIEALGFLLGSRASTSWLRHGAERLSVEGRFDPGDFPAQMRSQFKIGAGPVCVRRELDAAGKSRASVNGRPAQVSVLAAWGEGLLDFHGQHEHQTLLKPTAQLEALDAFAGLAAKRSELSALHRDWLRVAAELESARMSDSERLQRIEFDRFQLSEIDAAKLRVEEEGEIESDLPLLKNADRVRTLAESAYGALYEGEGSALEDLRQAERALEDLSRYDESLGEVRDGVLAARVAVEDAARRLADLRGRVEADPDRLDALIRRQDELARLKKKYGATLGEILVRRDELAGEIERLENSQKRICELEAAREASRRKLEAAAGRIHKQRVGAARRLEAALLKELKDLGMPQALLSVSVEFEAGRCGPVGGDEVEFLLAPNPGEPLKPLRSIASGGELSRVMLALKTVFAGADRVAILVFDEIDAGIGGAVARCVGERLAGLGRRHQLLCVTHLAQVACFGAAHFHVAKASVCGRTVVRVERLDGDRRLETVAQLLGGRAATDASRRHAQELLESSNL